MGRNYGIIAAAALFGVLGLGSGCGTGNGEGHATDSTQMDTTLKVELYPESFPVNEIPDNQFGKELEESENPTVTVVKGSLPKANSSAPEWLEAIISRESIVAFGRVMAKLPEELEFMQQTNFLVDGGKGWTAFSTTFTTKPSNHGIVVWGAFQSENEVYWASFNQSAPIEMDLANVQPLADGQGVSISGKMGESGKGLRAFRSELGKTSGKISFGKE